MSTAAIEYIWKAIRESERSDEIQVLDEMQITAPAHGSPEPQPYQSGAVSREPIAEVAINLRPVDSDTLKTVPVPSLP